MTSSSQTQLAKSLSIGLFCLRLSIGLVFTMWALDKVLVPEHAIKVFSGFYGLNLSSNVLIGLGLAQLAFIAAFVLGLWRNVTYLAILVLHAASTFSSFAKYLDPFNNLLFFAAWPMLAACLALYLLRDYDTWTLAKANNHNLSNPA
ncbi:MULTISPECIES: hypothetical protein [unclassified Agarivorans]|uniref:hypothetical protein n=1 Tax=unclassified Agarivorans TaxID=2636026 RepID=UPI0026E31E41|nr:MULTISPECIES: hypothetical protein [unclassified Agarivorans]MDO6687598.1 hypothetical protein [Agarivorans sp. 3_MG-2023]MDO6717069.1 hypothetical protein [Agarivorans sp. 2_MG-2023]